MRFAKLDKPQGATLSFLTGVLVSTAKMFAERPPVASSPSSASSAPPIQPVTPAPIKPVTNPSSASSAPPIRPVTAPPIKPVTTQPSPSTAAAEKKKKDASSPASSAASSAAAQPPISSASPPATTKKKITKAGSTPSAPPANAGARAIQVVSDSSDDDARSPSPVSRKKTSPITSPHTAATKPEPSARALRERRKKEQVVAAEARKTFKTPFNEWVVAMDALFKSKRSAHHAVVSITSITAAELNKNEADVVDAKKKVEYLEDKKAHAQDRIAKLLLQPRKKRTAPSKASRAPEARDEDDADDVMESEAPTAENSGEIEVEEADAPDAALEVEATPSTQPAAQDAADSKKKKKKKKNQQKEQESSASAPAARDGAGDEEEDKTKTKQKKQKLDAAAAAPSSSSHTVEAPAKQAAAPSATDEQTVKKKKKKKKTSAQEPAMDQDASSAAASSAHIIADVINSPDAQNNPAPTNPARIKKPKDNEVPFFLRHDAAAPAATDEWGDEL